MADGANSSDGRSKVSEEEILRTVSRELESGDAPALSTTEIAEVLPISRQAVKRRLEKLEEQGKISESRAGQNRFWWLPDETEEDIEKGSLSLDEIVEPGDLSDDVLADLAQQQLAADNLPEEMVEEVLTHRISSDDLEKELVIEAIQEKIQPEDLPADYSASIIETKFEYDTSYWGNQIRLAKTGFMLTVITFTLAFLLLTTNMQSDFFFVSQSTIGSAVQLLGTLLGSLAVILYFSSFGLLVWGWLGQQFSSTDDPRPWREYITSLRK